jgi:small GTP-binding protein
MSSAVKNYSYLYEIQVYSRIERKTCSTATIIRKKLKQQENEDIPVESIRNFSIVAHVDHGKSTLADRLLEMTGAITKNSGTSQVLDRLQVERERGITVKAQTASLNYTVDSHQYLLNLIDTPGHVDFSSEVSRSLAACQGVILLVDANQGVQAQTVANFYMAFGKELVIIPVLNKIDLKNADPDAVSGQLRTLFDFSEKDILKVSS